MFLSLLSFFLTDHRSSKLLPIADSFDSFNFNIPILPVAQLKRLNRIKNTLGSRRHPHSPVFTQPLKSLH